MAEGHKAAEHGMRMNFRRERERLGLTQAALARELGTDASQVSGWETGQMEPPVVPLVGFSEMCGRDLRYLLRREGCGETQAEAFEYVPPVEGVRGNMVRARRRMGLTGRAAARALGTGPREVCLWEKGKVCPGPRFLAAMCDLYGCEPRYLLRREGMEDQ